MTYGYSIRRSPFVPSPLTGNPYQITDEQIASRVISLTPSGDTSGATDAVQINGALALAAGQQAPVVLGAGNWYVNSSIVMGLADTSLRGFGLINTVINSMVNGPCIKVATTGDLVRTWNISRMTISTLATTVATNATGITIDSSIGGRLTDVQINVNGNRQVGLLCNPAQAALGNQFNTFNGMVVNLAVAALTSQAMFITSAATTQNSSFDEFYKTVVHFNHVSQTGLHLQTCDTILFYDLEMDAPSLMAPTCINFDYTGGNVHWPNACVFYGVDIGFNIDNSTPRIVNTGSPTVIPSPNVFYDFSTGNGGAQVFLPNIEYYGQLHTRVEGSLGYAPGAGTTVTQTVSAVTSVTANAICGKITLVSAARTSGTVQAFTVSNTSVAATDTVIANIQGGGTVNGYIAAVTGVGANSFNVTIDPLVTETAQPVVNFSVIKAVIS